jgi:hypothetical protein
MSLNCCSGSGGSGPLKTRGRRRSRQGNSAQRLRHISRLNTVLFTYFIQHCSICGLSDPTVSQGAGIEPRTVSPVGLAVSSSSTTAYYFQTIRRHVYAAL